MKRERILRRIRKIALVLFAAVVAAPVLLYAVLLLGWPPVLGNLYAAHALRSYAAQVHPDWAPEGRWAGYNLVDGCYSLDFAGSGEEHVLSYSPSDRRLVLDRERENALREELEIDRALRLSGLGDSSRDHIYWHASWDHREPETARIRLRMDIYCEAGAPVPEEAAMREAMADYGLKVYGVLAPLAEVDRFSVYYGHEGIRGKNRGLVWNTIDIDLDQGEELTREDILTAPLAAR